MLTTQLPLGYAEGVNENLSCSRKSDWNGGSRRHWKSLRERTSVRNQFMETCRLPFLPISFLVSLRRNTANGAPDFFRARREGQSECFAITFHAGKSARDAYVFERARLAFLRYAQLS